MRTQPTMALLAAFSLASGLWCVPAASAHDDDRWGQPYSSRSYAERYSDWYGDHYPNYSGGHYINPYYDPSRAHREEHDRLGEEHAEQHGALQHKYDKAMNRLARQEREAQEKAMREYSGNTSDPRYRERMAEIDRKYDQKRWK